MRRKDSGSTHAALAWQATACRAAALSHRRRRRGGGTCGGDWRESGTAAEAASDWLALTPHQQHVTLVAHVTTRKAAARSSTARPLRRRWRRQFGIGGDGSSPRQSTLQSSLPPTPHPRCSLRRWVSGSDRWHAHVGMGDGAHSGARTLTTSTPSPAGRHGDDDALASLHGANLVSYVWTSPWSWPQRVLWT